MKIKKVKKPKMIKAKILTVITKKFPKKLLLNTLKSNSKISKPKGRPMKSKKVNTLSINQRIRTKMIAHHMKSLSLTEMIRILYKMGMIKLLSNMTPCLSRMPLDNKTMLSIELL